MNVDPLDGPFKTLLLGMSEENWAQVIETIEA